MNRTHVFALTLFFVTLTGVLATPALGLDLSYRQVDSEIIGEGVSLSRYDLIVAGNTLPVRKLTVDLSNPHVGIQAMHPADGFNHRQTARQMAAADDAVAAINADFFHLTRPASPLGLHVQGGEILSSPSATNTWFGFGVDTTGAAHILQWFFRGEVICGGVSRHPLDGFNQTYSGTEGIYAYDRTWGSEVSSVFFGGPVMQVTVLDGIVASMKVSEESLAIPTDGFVVIARGEGADFLHRHLRVTTQMRFRLDIEPDVALDTAVGGHQLLVDGGRPVDPSKLSSPGAARASRSAVGIHASGRYVYFVTIDATPAAAGMTMHELSVFLSMLGMDRALNLDGGGSSTMVARRLGEWDLSLVSSPRHGLERSVVNAIGIFNHAPRTNAAALFVRGVDGLLIGAEASYEVSGYDEHYHPLRIEPTAMRWYVSDPEIAEITDGVLHAKNPGVVVLRAAYQGATKDKAVRVFGSDDIAILSVTPGEIRLLPGQQVSLAVEVETVTGVTLTAGPESVTWTADIGSVRDNVYRAGPDEGTGTLVAEIDGHTTEIPIRIGGKYEPFFTFHEWQTTSFLSHPAGLPGSFEIETEPQFVYSGERSGRLEYDFTQEVDGVMIAYAQLGSGQISMGTNNLGVSAQVYGDASGYWLRAEIFDADGRRRYLDLARAVTWKGWYRVEGAVDPSWAQPLMLSSIYLVHEPGTDAPKTGTIYIDQVEMIKGLGPDDDDSLYADMKMWVGSTEYMVRGEPRTMDATPFIDGGRTFVPVRYLGEAFGAEVDWTSDPETGLTDRVILTSDEIHIEMWIGIRTMSVQNRITGEMRTVELDVAPMVENGRTYLPFRAIGEDGFGARVDYSMHPERGGVDSVWIIR